MPRVVHSLEEAYYEINLGVVRKVQVEVISRGPGPWIFFQDLERQEMMATDVSLVILLRA